MLLTPCVRGQSSPSGREWEENGREKEEEKTRWWKKIHHSDGQAQSLEEESGSEKQFKLWSGATKLCLVGMDEKK